LKRWEWDGEEDWKEEMTEEEMPELAQGDI
jgi:hypothetical protein